MKYDYLILFKGEDQYIIRYRPGEEEKLYVMLKSYGDDEQLNLTSTEVGRLITKIKDGKKSAAPAHLHTQKQR
jgi:hypothetical protein